MKLKIICVLLIVACGSLLASPRKYPCPEREAAAARMEKAATETALADDTELLPFQRFSGTVL
jgi:hypothetical protein